MRKIARVLIGAVVLIFIIAIGLRSYEDYKRAQDLYVLQKWILVTAGGGEPIEIARWQTRSRCEDELQFVGRAYLERGVAVTLRCVPVNSLWQFILSRELLLIMGLVMGLGVLSLVAVLALASSGYDWGGSGVASVWLFALIWNALYSVVSMAAMILVGLAALKYLNVL